MNTRAGVALLAGLAIGVVAGAAITRSRQARQAAQDDPAPVPTGTTPEPDAVPAAVVPDAVPAAVVERAAVPAARPARRARRRARAVLLHLLAAGLSILAWLWRPRVRPAAVRLVLPAPPALPVYCPRPPVCRRIVAMRRALPVRGPDASASRGPFRTVVGVT